MLGVLAVTVAGNGGMDPCSSPFSVVANIMVVSWVPNSEGRTYYEKTLLFNNLSYGMSDSNKSIHILFLHSLLSARNLVPKACQLRYMDYSKYTQNHGSQGGDYKKLLNP